MSEWGTESQKIGGFERVLVLVFLLVISAAMEDRESKRERDVVFWCWGFWPALLCFVAVGLSFWWEV